MVIIHQIRIRWKYFKNENKSYLCTSRFFKPSNFFCFLLERNPLSLSLLYNSPWSIKCSSDESWMFFSAIFLSSYRHIKTKKAWSPFNPKKIIFDRKWMSETLWVSYIHSLSKVLFMIGFVILMWQYNYNHNLFIFSYPDVC